MTQPTTPTQVLHPWRATLRTTVQATVALLPVLPAAVVTAGVDSLPWVISVVAVAAAVTRVMQLPAVHDWISDYIPWLAPQPKASPPDGTAQGGPAD